VGTADAVLIPVIYAAQTPTDAALGALKRQVRLDWEQVKTQVMREATVLKFLTHTDIQAILISTGDELIVENSQLTITGLWWR